MDDEHGNVMPALQVAQVGEQRGDLAAGVLVDAVDAARATFQNGVAMKLSRHHMRHRSTVRRSTPITSVSSRMRSAVAPCRRIAINTTIAAM
jgi:hypothetical protein